MKRFFTAILAAAMLLTVTGYVSAADPVGVDCTNPPNLVPFADLRKCDLSGREMEGVNLTSANLSGANLDDASLFTSTLRNANFDGASLRRTSMEDADAIGASFVGADLPGQRPADDHADVTRHEHHGQQGDTVTLGATAADTDGTVICVEFFAGTTGPIYALSQPYTAAWVPTVAGTYAVTAKATDNDLASTTSQAVTVTKGNHTLTVKAYDDDGAVTTSAPVTVRVR
jgi:hypothetical protein